MEIQMSVVEILGACERDGSRLVKESIIAANAKNDLLKRVMKLAIDPYVNFGVYKLTLPAVKLDCDSDAALAVYCDVLDKLATRELSGNAARDAVVGSMALMDAATQRWAHRILLKNLRCGVSEKTVNKTWPGLISRFEIMAANKIETTKDGRPKGVRYPVWIEPKLDGHRMVALKHNGIVELRTRNGNEFEAPLPRIRKALAECPFDNFALDGEVMASDWNETDSIVSSSSNVKSDETLFYNVFEMLSYDEWKGQNCPDSHAVRYKNLEKFTSSFSEGSPIRLVPGQLVHDDDELYAAYVATLAKGFEGLMLKDQGARYEHRRTDAIMKYKPVMTTEGVIVGWYKGAVGKKREGVFAGFNVLLDNGVTTRVGNGFSDALKSQIHGDDPDTYVGKIVECESQPPLTKDGCMRFPVFCRFRSVDDVDKTLLEAYDAWREKNAVG